MKRRGFLKSLLMGAAFVALSKVLPGGQSEFVEEVEESETATGATIAHENYLHGLRIVESIDCDPDRLYYIDMADLSDLKAQARRHAVIKNITPS